MKKTILKISFFSLIFIGCSKNNSNNNSSSGSYSNWILTTSNYDNGSYNSHPNNTIYSTASFGTPDANTLSGDGFIDSSNTYNKATEIFISFASKPVASGVYKIGNKQSLTGSTCSIVLNGSGLNYYQSNVYGEPVNVTVNGGLVTVTFNNITLSGTNQDPYNLQTWSATISGSVFEGR
jgi:hypothetical protein